MIVVDTNTIAYLYLPSKYASSVEALLFADPHWIAPQLWRSELRNILATQVRHKIIEFETACNIQIEAEEVIGTNEYTVDSNLVLALARDSGCTAYDCEFICLAQSLELRLITADKKLIRRFEDIAMTAKDYLAAVP